MAMHRFNVRPRVVVALLGAGLAAASLQVSAIAQVPATAALGGSGVFPLGAPNVGTGGSVGGSNGPGQSANLPGSAIGQIGGAVATGFSTATGTEVNAPGLSALPGVIRRTAGNLANPLSAFKAPAGAGRLTNQTMNVLDVRGARLNPLVAANLTVLDIDPRGAPVVRSQVVLIQPSANALAAATAAGFAVVSRETLEGLDLALVVLTAPEGLSTSDAVAAITRLDPKVALDFNHLYTPSGTVAAAAAQASAEIRSAPISSIRIGLIDTGVDAAHPAFAEARVEQRPFAPGGVVAQAHGTAIASLMVGASGDFRGVAPGGALYVADVYGSGPTGGSVEAIVRGLAWLGARKPSVIDVSLVGPANRVLEAAVGALIAQGVIIVAPVGNEGPAAAPLFPASYRGVIAVTGVDARGRLLLEAGRASHVDFAAPGADVVAATIGGGFARMRGTSFAAPIIAAKLAQGMTGPSRAQADASVAALSNVARRVGRAFGRGLVGADPVIASAAR